MRKLLPCLAAVLLVVSAAKAFGQYTVSQFNALPFREQYHYYEGSVKFFMAKVEPYDPGLAIEMRTYFLAPKSQTENAPGYDLFFTVIRKNDPLLADTSVDSMVEHICSHRWDTRFGKAMYQSHQNKR